MREGIVLSAHSCNKPKPPKSTPKEDPGSQGATEEEGRCLRMSNRFCQGQPSAALVRASEFSHCQPTASGFSWLGLH